jgi:excisionase family DNA binding protein
MSATTTSPAPLLTVPEVARRLGLHRDTVYRKIDRGEIPAIRIGPDDVGPLRVREEEFEAWLEARRLDRGAD